MQFVISQTSEVLVSHSGLALAGSLLFQSDLRKQINAITLKKRKRPEVLHSDVISSMIGLLCLGKPDFAAIEEFRNDEFFRRALHLRKIPSEETLRQRMDQCGHSCDTILRETSASIVAQYAPDISPCYRDWVALDIDVSPFDNSNTKKEGVSWTYKKVDGYAPILAYVGEEGYLVHAELREGSQHCQQGTPDFLDQSIELARKITSKKLLVRLDAGNDDLENIRRCRKQKVDYIIKRNIRKESLEDWLEEAQALGKWEEPRPGKEVYVGDTSRTRDGQRYRVVFEVTRRTITADGQRLLVPEIEVASYWASLKASPEQIIALYHQHGTSEQFHSEIKTDMDLERFPSGKFATNALVLSCGLMAFNILRLCGQNALQQERELPSTARRRRRTEVRRRRLRSVMQDLFYMASRLTKHAHRFGLSLWENNPWREIWGRVYHLFLQPRYIS